ncbi:hypothetical protein TWF679_002635 [Orbilia oligospora]|uniref:Ankyrin repeat domain-containing protein n=1 Tax=Orbilia oligospora TaxID=2813651 RepID=A0A8H8UT01_ORBOL|nr:hypothetical protein TWF679_002635 [Orbilia oligospora]
MPSGKDISNQPLNFGSEALYLAVLIGDLEKVRLLLGEGANPNASCACICGTTCLSKAAEKGYLKIFNLLIKSGASWDTRNKDGESPEDLAIRNGHSLVIRRLSVANLDRQDDWFSAARDGRVEEMRALIDRSGLDPGMRSSAGSTALDIAINHNQKGVIELLKDKRSNTGVPLTKMKDSYGMTASQLAERSGDVGIIKLLPNTKGE